MGGDVHQISFLWSLAGTLGVIALTQTVRLSLSRRRPRQAAILRARAAVHGEREGARTLKRHGFVILNRQARTLYRFVVDNEPQSVTLRADYIVRRGGQTYVAEVKTGELAPQLRHGPTRRQLLEYSLAFDVDGVVLVCPEQDEVHVVAYPTVLRPPRAAIGTSALLPWLVLTVVVAWLVAERM